MLFCPGPEVGWVCIRHRVGTIFQKIHLTPYDIYEPIYLSPPQNRTLELEGIGAKFDKEYGLFIKPRGSLFCCPLLRQLCLRCPLVTWICCWRTLILCCC